jgi:DNA-binding MarR family transcriptional regulator
MDTDEKIFAALERLQTASRAALTNAGVQNGLSTLQAQLLQLLQRRDGMRPSTLAAQLQVSKPTVSDAVATLVAKGLVMRKRQKADARSHELGLTKKGRAETLRLGGYATPFLQSLEALSSGQKSALWEALLNLLRALESNGFIPHQRMCLSCEHFHPNAREGTGFCGLLQSPLAIQDLRLDCPDHQATDS